MIKAVADSGPFIHLASIGQIDLLRRYCHPILIAPQVYKEVVTQRTGKPGALELATMYEAGAVQILDIVEQQLGDRLRHASPPTLSNADVMVVALAIEQQAAVVSDDAGVRELAMRESVPVIGSIGILVQARREGAISVLKPLLDQLIAAGFHVNPQGQVYRDALRKVGEM
jgi:predicted nucleic acid-binding protein